MDMDMEMDMDMDMNMVMDMDMDTDTDMDTNNVKCTVYISKKFVRGSKGEFRIYLIHLIQLQEI
jgi:hypothetical protein